MHKKTTPYGLWQSPISPEMLASKSTRYGQMQFIDDAIYWLESRPHEQGRGVIVRSRNGQREDVTPEGYNVRTRVHEYAGGDFWGRGEYLLFADDTNQQLCLQNLNTNNVDIITPEPPVKRSLRYCDGEVAPNMAYTVCVHERHEIDEVINELVVISLSAPYTKRVIAQGDDFIQIRVSARMVSSSAGFVGIIQTCLGMKQSYGLLIFLRLAIFPIRAKLRVVIMFRYIILSGQRITSCFMWLIQKGGGISIL